MKKGYICIATVLLSALMMTGCKNPASVKPAEAESTSAIDAKIEAPDHFEGANMSFSYDGDTWRLSYTQDAMGITYISAYNPDNRAVVTMAAFEKEDLNEREFFDVFRLYEDEIQEETINYEEQGDVSIDTMSYWVDRSNEKRERRCYLEARVYRFSKNRNIIVAAEYYQEEDYAAIETILQTLDDSKQEKFDGVSKAKERDLNLARDLEFYLEDTLREENKSKLDLEFRKKSGFEYLREVDMLSWSGNLYVVMLPEYDRYEGEYYINEVHGVDISLDIAESYGDQLEVLLKENVELNKGIYEESSRDYQNIVLHDVVVKEDCYYQIMEYEWINYKGAAEKIAEIYYVEDINGKEYVFMELGLIPSEYDHDTNGLLQELEQEYGLELSEYYADEGNLTNGGNVVDRSEEVYECQSGDQEVVPLEGYSLLGEGLLTSEGEAYRIIVPRGKNTYNKTYSVRFDLYGISGDTNISTNIWEISCLEYAAKQFESSQEYYKKDNRYYKKTTDIRKVSGTDEDVAILAFTTHEVAYDNSTNLVYRVFICKDLGNNMFERTDLTIRTNDLSKYSEELMKQYGQALELDLNEIFKAFSEEELELTDEALPDDVETL